VKGFKDFEPLFITARKAGLKTTLHIAEITNLPDNDSILAFAPDRLGHGVLLSPGQVEVLKKAHIPVEVCPTNYQSTLQLLAYSDTPNVKWMKEQNHPFTLGTDNTCKRQSALRFLVLFNTNATGERFEIAHAFGYSFQEMQLLELNAADMIFDDAHKPWLRAKLAL
jgi:adenosine deaminase